MLLNIHLQLLGCVDYIIWIYSFLLNCKFFKLFLNLNCLNTIRFEYPKVKLGTQGPIGNTSFSS
jgi:hypothetical protein